MPDLNQAEVFKLAQNLEMEGISFYKKAAEYTMDPLESSLFEDLAEMEAAHFSTFVGLEKEHRGQTYIDHEAIAQYIAVHFPTGIFHESKLESGRAVFQDTKELFQYAWQMEQDSVEYYQVLKVNIENRQVRQVLETIIEEEKKHAEMMSVFFKEIQE